MNKGFTLIELLAVIVILAIIALIAAPIVLGIINDSKESATLRSAEYYLDAVEQSIVKNSMTTAGNFFPSRCEVVETTGNLLCDNSNNELDVSVKGEKPISGEIIFVDGSIKKANLIYSNIKITMNNEGKLVIGDSSEYSICKLVSGDANSIGSKYQCEVKSKTKYYFYVLSHNADGTTNLIMDRNICEDGTIATSINTCLVAWNSSGVNTNGPTTAMAYLNKATSSWENIPNLDTVYVDDGGNFQNFKITGKARMPKYDEVYGADKCLLYNDNNNQYGSCPLWLVNNLNNSEYYKQENGKVNISGIWGYWTLTSGVGNTTGAWHLHYYGDIGIFDVNCSDHLGVRPVITLNIE